MALGAPLGRFVWGGQHRVLPPRLRTGSLVSIVLYAFIALVLLARAGAVPLFGGTDAPFVVIATWVIFAYFALGILTNAISRSKPERYTMTPACARARCEHAGDRARLNRPRQHQAKDAAAQRVRFSRTRMLMTIGEPSKPYSSRRRRCTKRR